MEYRKPQFIITDINFDNDDDAQDEVLSQFSNSDLQEFNNFERDIYGGGVDDVSSEDQMHSQPLPNDTNESGDEISDSLRLILPKILVQPSLGDPIQTYDQLRGQYRNNSPLEPLFESVSHSVSMQESSMGKKPSSYNPRVSSRMSDRSAETVLSQNDEIEEPLPRLPTPVSKTRNIHSSISSTESAAHQSTHRSHNKATQRILLDKEREVRKDQDKYISHLQHTINQLLTKHALAEETIDQLRLGVVINTQTRIKDQRLQRRTPGATKKKLESRRYSSILDNANYQDYADGPNMLSRAKSVDMSMFDEECDNVTFGRQRSNNDFGGSMKQIDNGVSRETDITNDIRMIGDYFQSRIKILNEAANNLQSNSSGRASASSGSNNGEISVSGKIVHDSQRHTPLARRLQNLQKAYEGLQEDFNGFRQMNKKSTTDYTDQQNGGLQDVEGDMFELGMKIDDLERSIVEGRETPTNNYVSGTPDRDQELITRFANVEEKYQHLIDRYNNLKGSRTPVRQRQLDDVVQQLQSLVRQANGRYPSIPTPDKLESIMQRDIIDKIKLHMASDSPPYFLTEEDGLSSGNSSFGKGHRRRKAGYRLPRSEEDSDFRPQNGERLSPIKSRVSTHIVAESPQHVRKPTSLPVSVVSSNSMWQGATSGETLPLDDQGVLRDSLSRKGNSSAGSEVFQFASKSVEDMHEFRRQSKGNNTYNPRMKAESFVTNRSPLHDDIKRLDEQLAKVELEEKRQISATRDSDAAGSRNTRSLLGTSPSNSIVSRHSRLPSSAASSHKSTPTSNGHRNYSQTEPREERKKRRTKSRYVLPDSVSESEDDTPSEDYDLADYVKSASCGLGPRSRYVRSKNKNLQDRWSQTPLPLDRGLPMHRKYDRQYPEEMDDAYIDDVAYWDGVAFHPSRESTPGKSILRRSSPHRKQQRDGHRPRSLYAPNERDSLPRMSQYSRVPANSLYPEPSVSREYFKMEPYRYLVREYGQRPNTYDPSMFEEESEDEYGPYDNYIEERRLRTYLDEAVKAAQSMKRYTKRISELCEQKRYEDDYSQAPQQRNYRDHPYTLQRS